MKKYLLFTLPFALTACSLPQQQSTVPMDMKAVQDYQYRVSTGNTVDKNHPQPKEELNQSDKRSKNVTYYPAVPAIYPSVGFGRWYY